MHDPLQALLHDLRQGKGTVRKLMTDEQLYAEMRAFVASADTVVSRSLIRAATANAARA